MAKKRKKRKVKFALPKIPRVRTSKAQITDFTRFALGTSQTLVQTASALSLISVAQKATKV